MTIHTILLLRGEGRDALVYEALEPEASLRARALAMLHGDCPIIRNERLDTTIVDARAWYAAHNARWAARNARRKAA